MQPVSYHISLALRCERHVDGITSSCLLYGVVGMCGLMLPKDDMRPLGCLYSDIFNEVTPFLLT